MSIGIIGAGALGSNLARLLAKSGIRAMISNRRGPQSLAELAKALGPTIEVGTVEQAASAEVVVVALRWADLGKVLGGLPVWDSRIVVDATNPVTFLEPGSAETRDPGNPLAAFGIKAVDLDGEASSRVFSRLAPGARVVKAFNHIEATLLPQPAVSGGQRVLFYSGDDADAKAEIRKLLDRTGHFPVDLGGLDIGGHLASPPFGPLALHNFIRI